MPKIPSATTAMALAKSIFLASPARNRRSPAAVSSTVTVRLESCPSMSWYRTMGPAISWGKKEMYKSSFQKLFCICPGFQYTSRT